MNLEFTYAGWNVSDTGAQVLINAANASPFSFPIPALNIGVYDSNNNYLGTVNDAALQWVNPNGNTQLTAVLKPTGSAGGLLQTALSSILTSGQSLQNLTFKGTVMAGVANVPVNFTQTITA